MSLRLKTIAGVAIIEAILLTILIFTIESHMRDSAAGALEKRAKTTATLFATTSKDPVLSYDLASLEAFSLELLTNPDLEYVRVRDSQGQIFASEGNEDILARKFVKDNSLDDVDDGVLDYSVEIKEADLVYGSVELGINTNAINQLIDDNRKMSIAIAAVEMSMVALFSFLLGTYLTKQLNDLRKSAKRISEGDYTVEIPVNSTDEMGEVAKAFNKMMSALRASEKKRDLIDAELIQANQTLEDRVERRTAQIQKQMLELQAANDQIAATQSQLVQSEKMASIGQLAAGVAHEVNNPIGFVRSNLNTLAEYVRSYQQLLDMHLKYRMQETDRETLGKEITALEKELDISFINEDIDELIKDSIEGTTRIRDIVQGLKNFSRENEAGKSLCDLNECIASTLKIVNNELKYKCKIETEILEVPPVRANQGQISQVLMNLLINAGHAVDTDGQIKISTQPEDDGVCIIIEDNGKGIKESDISKLFDPFFTTKPVGEGTGLGLSISFGIIQDHGGTIDVTSEVGVGTVFTVHLPAGSEPLSQAA